MYQGRGLRTRHNRRHAARFWKGRRFAGSLENRSKYQPPLLCVCAPQQGRFSFKFITPSDTLRHARQFGFRARIGSYSQGVCPLRRSFTEHASLERSTNETRVQISISEGLVFHPSPAQTTHVSFGQFTAPHIRKAQKQARNPQ